MKKAHKRKRTVITGMPVVQYALRVATESLLNGSDKADSVFDTICRDKKLTAGEAAILRDCTLLTKDAMERYIRDAHPTNVPHPLGCCLGGEWSIVTKEDGSFEASVKREDIL